MWRAAVLALAILSAQPVLAQQQGLPGDPPATGRMNAEDRRLLAGVARNAATASQLGALAGARLAGTPQAELGQAVAATNTALEQHLARLAGPENLPLRERLDQRLIERLQALSRTDRDGFGRELAAWVATAYPETIRGLDQLGRRDGRYAALATAALPPLRRQLAAAQDMTQAAAVPDMARRRPAPGPSGN